MPTSDQLRSLPSVEELAVRLAPRFPGYPRSLVVSEARAAIDAARAALRAGRQAPDPEQSAAEALSRLGRPSLRGVVNATGVVLHTNLGRAPLPRLEALAGYSNLEYDVATGRRGKRDAHIAELLQRLLGAPAIAVNNNAAAVYLALRALAGGGEVIVSRGELIEIGDGFRIPDIMAESGAVLREVGTTNRTSLEDYREAINERTRLLLRVHPSNFRIQGFTAKPSLEELVALGRETGLPVYEDLGSGCLADLSAFGVAEPTVRASLDAGVDLVSFSGDKLLGGPQAGILAGRPELVARLRKHPMYRALRLDKLILQALQATLRHAVLEHWEDIPALAMIRMPAEQIRVRAEQLAAGIAGAAVVAGESVIGGGSTPEQSLPTFLIALEGDVVACEAALRAADPPVIARIADGRLLVDLRTVLPEQEAHLAAALARSCGA